MSTVNIYVIYDKLAEEAGPLFIAVNDEVAKRQYEQTMQHVTTKADYLLYRIGFYDNVNMEVVPDVKAYIM